MLWFNPAKQHGFIRTEEGERLLIELSGFAPGHVLGERCAGTAVEFEREAAEVEGGFRAVDVKVVESNSGGRARSRRRGI
jgi:cold shock CspA family protein